MGVSMKNQTLYIDRFSSVSSLVVTSKLQFLRLNPERSKERGRERDAQCVLAPLPVSAIRPLYRALCCLLLDLSGRSLENHLHSHKLRGRG